MEQIYILKLEHEKWYIGKSGNINKRFEQHINGIGAKWTQLYKPISIEETRELLNKTDEDDITLEYMKKYGIENVRGGIYCNVEFKSYELNKIESLINNKEILKKINEINNKIKNEFINPDSDLRSGRWFRNLFK